MKPDDEQIWLRHKVIRMRTLLRYAKEPCVEARTRRWILDMTNRVRRFFRLTHLECFQSQATARSNTLQVLDQIPLFRIAEL
jgi:hypothetical protein